MKRAWNYLAARGRTSWRWDKVRLTVHRLALPGILVLLLGAQDLSGSDPARMGPQGVFIKGADLSFLQQVEDHGAVFMEKGVARDALDIFKDHGINYIRLRIWHSPVGGYNNLEKTLAMARRIKEKGFGFLLDFHYSDTWADPGKQTTPAAWTGLPLETLGDSVYEYTRHVISQFKDQNTLPDMVQIGNEIICGMLWDDGRVCRTFDTPEQWSQLGKLVGEGIRGVKAALSRGDSVRIMIHIDRGADSGGSIWFFDNLIAEGVEFDVIGLSFYPWWHGTLGEVKANLDTLAGRYHKDIIIAEAAYPWTLAWHDDTHNPVGLSEQLHPGYPATVEGQKAFITDLMRIVVGVRDHRGLGLVYWSPEYVSVPALGSSWENLTLFDFTGELLSSIGALDSAVVGSEPASEISEPID